MKLQPVTRRLWLHGTIPRPFVSRYYVGVRLYASRQPGRLPPALRNTVAVTTGVLAFVLFPPILTLLLSGILALGAYRTVKTLLSARRLDFNPFDPLFSGQFASVAPEVIREVVIQEYAKTSANDVLAGDIESFSSRQISDGARLAQTFEIQIALLDINTSDVVGSIQSQGEIVNGELRIKQLRADPRGQPEDLRNRTDNRTVTISKDHYKVKSK